ncbi:hypothetical protein E4U17_005769 [Claviceps sp. LM77 group G4]|nr:hypothetical protein E4U17_005769 [Claviceps sp. LM77 group G4]KAG6067012.1 hypothetical protein E4U33_005452 [Claviceps sp. LM78 group G4]KAG6071600.1 hypothetical protein E4U16_006011 [Claviceps sp. LM84 group G4]
MSRSLMNRLRALPLNNFSRSKNTVLVPSWQASRCFSQSSAQWDSPPKDDDPKVSDTPAPLSSDTFLDSIMQPSSSRERSKTFPNATDPKMMVFEKLNTGSGKSTSRIDIGVLTGKPSEAKMDDLEPFHFMVYSHKHNTHITFTKPNREPILSMSCGNLGYRKSRRGTFDSAYSLTKYVLERILHTKWIKDMNKLELIFRGFGQGREAVIKVIMSPEGKIVREKIIRVADSTRIKYAGTRSSKPRRL